jgi:DNA primase
VGELAHFIREIGDPVQRAHYIQRIASALRVPEDAVQEAVGRRRPTDDRRRTNDERRRAAEGRAEQPPTTPPMEAMPEEHLLGLVLLYPQTTWMAGAPAAEDFIRLENRLIYAAMVAAAIAADKAAPKGEAVREAAKEALDPALHPHFDRILNREEPELYRFALPYELEGRLKRLRRYNDLMWNQQCGLMLQEAQQSGDKETIAKLLPLWSKSLARYQHYDPKQSTVYRDTRD